MERRQQIIAITVLAVLIIAVLVYFVGIPQVEAYQQMSAQLHKLQAQVNSDRITTSSLRTVTSVYSETKSDLDMAGKLFDTEMRDGSHAVLLGLGAAAAEVTITSVTPGIIVEKPNYLELPLDLTASGNYLKVVAFYTDLENLTNLTDLRIFKIVAAPTVTDDSNVTITMSMVVFMANTPTEKLTLEEISNWAIGRDNVFEPLDGFGQVGTVAQGGGVVQAPGAPSAPSAPSAPALPQVPQEPFQSGSLKSVMGAVPVQPANSAALQK